MKTTPILAFLLICFGAFGQVSKIDSLRSQTNRYDSILEKRGEALDSTLRSPQAKIDALQSKFYQDSDSLKLSYKQKLSGMDSASSSLNHKIDSLQALKLPTEKYTAKLDSVNAARKSAVASLDSKVAELKSKTTGQLKKLDIPPELNEKLSSATKDIDGFQLPVKDLNIPGLDSPDNPLKSLDGINASVQSPFGEIGKIDGLQNIGGDLGKVTDVTGQLGAYQGDLKNIASGNLGDVKAIPTALENKAGALTGITDMQKQADGALAPIQNMTEQVQNPEAMKEAAIEKVQEVAINHFAGKEEVLKTAMDKLAKYKKKYSSLNSLSDIGKKRPNEMRDKPVIERIVPGISMQVMRRDRDLLIDFNPYLGYRLTGRLTAGAGWNERVLFGSKNISNQNYKVYGPRVYGEYKLGRGLTPRLEIEMLNTYVPSFVSSTPQDPTSRRWVMSYIAGIKRDYKIYKGIKGTAMILFNLYDPMHKSPYPDRVISRIGFEFQIKKKAKK